MKKVVSLILILVIITVNIQTVVLAYQFPQAFWAPNSKYEAALKANNHNEIIKYGKQLIDIMKNEPACQEKHDVMISRYTRIGNSYVALGDYDNAAKIFESLYNYTKPFGDKYYDYTRSASEKKKQFASKITMYTDKGTPVYYGAKNERYNGVLYGLCTDGETTKKAVDASMMLMYQNLGGEMIVANENNLKEASETGKLVVYALNCPEEGDTIKKIWGMETQLKEISDLFKKYPSTPIYLRFGAEFDVWSKQTTPDEYKNAFRYVSRFFKDRNSNVAIVWNPNYVSAWRINANDYYPGDEYVDWVGISLYTQKYFLGDKNQSAENEIVFRAGKNADPVLAVKDIVETYGNRKPIMISESGCGHKALKIGEDTSAFALRKLQEQYSYLPMIYPQIKLIAYFDWHVSGASEKYDYRLFTNPALQSEYLQRVKGRRFIQRGTYNSTYYNRAVYNGIILDSIFEVSCYAHVYGADLQEVTYFIDGKYVGASQDIPYTTVIDGRNYEGHHVLKANAKFSNGRVLTTESKVYIGKAYGNINVKISGNPVTFDQQPVLYNSRTMVPMRKIFESLGAQVTWDEKTRTATGIKGDRCVKVTVGHNEMYVNDKKIILDTAPITLSDRTLVPVRAVAEGLGCTVNWDESLKTVLITQ